jgi:hypothetical protein
MTRRRLPLWLLRDAPALAGVLATLFLLVATISYHAFVRRRPTTPTQRAHLFNLLATAETFFDFAIMREAYRRLGFNHRALKPTPYDPPTSLAECDTRFQAWLRCAENLDHFANIATEEVRRAYRISRAAASARVAHGSTDAGLRPAAHHEAVGAARTRKSSNTHKQFTLMVSRPHSGRPSNHEGELRCRLIAEPRAPPTIPIADCLFPIASPALASEIAPVRA